jgi:ribosomal protein S18 acetylase RimI-like enzyme
MHVVDVTRTYLEMKSESEFRPAFRAEEGLRLEPAIECPASFYRYLYREVGRRYRWTDRAGWSDERIRAHLARPEVTLWVLYRAGTPVGYFELEAHGDGSTEIAYFGLLPEFIGTGLGKHLLSLAVERAWAGAPQRVWLHTCTLDDRAALPNYLRRGFSPYREERYSVEVPPAGAVDEHAEAAGEDG